MKPLILLGYNLTLFRPQGQSICRQFFFMFLGVIIGDRDRKCALFLVLGLSQWYGTFFFLFLEKIARSCAAHARTCCNGVRNSRNVWCFWQHNSNSFMSVAILLQHFRGKLLHFEWSKTMSNLVMSCFMSPSKLCSAASVTRSPRCSTLSFTYIED